MTGLLAITGIVVVLAASAYAGVTNDEPINVQVPGMEITPVTDANPSNGSENGSERQNRPAATPTPEPAEPEPTQVLNREDCNQIRGTDYFSPEERTWFLANCVNR